MKAKETRRNIYEFIFDELKVKMDNKQKKELNKLLRVNYDVKMEELNISLKRYKTALERKNKELEIKPKKKKFKKIIKKKKEDETPFFNSDFIS